MLTCGASVNYHLADASASNPKSLNHCLRKSSDSEVALLTWLTFSLKPLWQGTCKSLRRHGGKRPTFINLEACPASFADGAGHHRDTSVCSLCLFVPEKVSYFFESYFFLARDPTHQQTVQKDGKSNHLAELWMMISAICDISDSQAINQSMNSIRKSWAIKIWLIAARLGRRRFSTALAEADGCWYVVVIWCFSFVIYCFWINTNYIFGKKSMNKIL